MAKHDLFDYLTTSAIAASALFTGAMAWFTRGLARRSEQTVKAAEREAKAVEEQGTALVAQATATSEQAKATAAQAGAAQGQLALARESYRASAAPWLTLGDFVSFPNSHASMVAGQLWNGNIPPIVVFVDKNYLRASISVRNVGSGLAVLKPDESRISGWVNPKSANPETRMGFVRGASPDPLLPPGEQTRVEFEMDLPSWQTTFDDVTHMRLGGRRELYFEIVYTDVSGQITARAHFHGTERQQGTADWEALDIEYYRPMDAQEPEVVVRYR